MLRECTNKLNEEEGQPEEDMDQGMFGQEGEQAEFEGADPPPGAEPI